ncbi:MAG: hypothetical protein DPW09_43415, partial [Anaerolineae bacterium]|nr:hypothetical protein [Anaerolineae bacterium]
ESGLTQQQIDRLHAPIGLDLGGRTPAEIALSIMAEIVAVRNSSDITKTLSSMEDGPKTPVLP